MHAHMHEVGLGRGGRELIHTYILTQVPFDAPLHVHGGPGDRSFPVEDMGVPGGTVEPGSSLLRQQVRALSTFHFLLPALHFPTSHRYRSPIR